MSDFTMELLCCEETILSEIEDKRFKRKNVALTYYFCLISSEDINWGKVNRAIIRRWSHSGLNYIKTEAWKWHDKKVKQRKLEALLNNCVDNDEAILLKREIEELEKER